MTDFHPVRRPAPVRRRKGSIEIYFVLYLSAIILLLGTTPAKRASSGEELEEVILRLMARDFQVKTRQAALLYSFVPVGVSFDTTGTSFRHDSMNLVFAVGDVGPVEFSIVSILDSSTGDRVSVEQASLVPRGEREALFLWRPGAEPRDAVYTVSIEGRTPLKVPATLSDPELRRRASEVLSRRPYIRDTTSFSITLMSVDTPDRILVLRKRDSATPPVNLSSLPEITESRAPAPPATAGSSVGTLSLNVNDAEVLALPSSRWRNRIWINGATSGDLTISAPPGVSVSGNAQGYIEVSGTTPATGQQIVSISARRKSDGASQRIEFPVRATSLPDPPIPAKLLVGETYTFDFGVAGVAPGHLIVEVEENGAIVTPRSRGLTTIRYSPSTVGKVTFVRYLDGLRVGATAAEIEEPAPPTLSSHVQQGSDVIVTAMSFGKSWRGAQNIPRLVVLEGNARNPIPVGQPRYDDDAKRWVQSWRIERDDPTQPLALTVYVLDQRGSGRKSRDYQIIVP